MVRRLQVAFLHSTIRVRRYKNIIMVSSDIVQPLEYAIKKTTPKDATSIINFLRTHYYKDGPLISTLTSQGTMNIKRWEIDLVTNCINYSFKAVNSTNNIIGIALNRMKHETNNFELIKYDPFKDLKQTQPLDLHKSLMKFIENNYNIFQLYPNQERALHLNVLCIDSNYRRKGIAEALLNRSFDSMKEIGVTVADLICTSYYSAVLCKKMNLSEVYRFGYDQFKVNGEVAIKLPEPHKEVRIFVKTA